MTETNKPVDIEKETSFVTYIGKEIYQTAVMLVGSAGGAIAGLFVTKPFFKNAAVSESMQRLWQSTPWISKIPGLGKPISESQIRWGGLGGLFAGTIASSMVLGYEHWKKIKQAQLQVDEITQDISDIEVFKKTDPELKAENERLWAELHKRDKAHPAHSGTHDEVHASHSHHASEHGDHPKSMAEKHAGHKKESWQETAQAQSEHAAEASL